MFDLIVADPPWSFNDRLTMSGVRRSAESQYLTLSGRDLIDLGPLVQAVTNPEAALLALWVVGSQLQLGLDTLNAWGFQQKQTYVWAKTRKQWSSGRTPVQNLAFGMGRLFRQSHELVLIGTRGKVYGLLDNRSQRSVCFEAHQGHSTKPESFQDSLELMFPTSRKLELFARRQRPGWTCLGLDINGQDIRAALQSTALTTALDYQTMPPGS